MVSVCVLLCKNTSIINIEFRRSADNPFKSCSAFLLTLSSQICLKSYRASLCRVNIHITRQIYSLHCITPSIYPNSCVSVTVKATHPS